MASVTFDAARAPNVPPFLWKWERHETRFDIPTAGEQGCAYWIVDELRAFVWVGKLQIMPVDVRPPADIGGDEMLPFEDQLDREERLRVEALALAIQFAQAQHHGKPRPSRAGDTIQSIAAEVHELADEFRKYIEDGLPAADEEEDEESEE